MNRYVSWFFIVLFTLGSAPSLALETTIIDFNNLPGQQAVSGTYQIRLGAGTWEGTATAKVRVRIDAQGNEFVEYVEIDSTKPVFVGSPITGETPPPPPPPPTGDTVSKSKAVVKQINDADTTIKMAAAYTSIILLKDNFKTPQEVGQAVNAASNQILSNNATLVKWSPWITFYSTEFTRLDQEQNIDTVDKYLAVLASMRDGMTQALQDSTNAININIATIISVVQTVLSIIEDVQTGNLDWTKVLQLVQEVINIFKARNLQVQGSSL